MYVRQSGEVSIDGDKLDIDYQPNTAKYRAVFCRHVTDELADRSMTLTGTLRDRQLRLREQRVTSSVLVK
jgi:hypothetical protein